MPLAGLLAALLGVSPAVAQVISTILLTIGAGAAVTDMINRLSTAAGEDVYVLVGGIRVNINRGLQSNVGQNAIQGLGMNVNTLQQQITQALNNRQTEYILARPLPAFANLDNLRDWIEEKARQTLTGEITIELYNICWQHFGLERTRLTTLLLQGLIPPPSGLAVVRYQTGELVPLTSREVPGVYWLYGEAVYQAQMPQVMAAPAEVELAGLVPTAYGAVPAAAAAAAVLAPAVTVIPGVGAAPQVSVTVQPAQVSVYPQISVPQPYVDISPGAVAIDYHAPTITNTVDTAGLMAGLGLLGTTFATSLAAQAANIGHSMSTGRARCFASTGDAMISNILNAATPLALALSLDKFGPFRSFLDNLFTGAWNEVLSDPALARPVIPERAPEVSRALFMKALQAGMTAHLVSAVAESVAPLKSLGLGYLAAFLCDMAGFAKIGGAMMGALESQALGLPFKYFINDKVRSYIPNVGELSRWAGEYGLVDGATKERLNKSLSGMYELDRQNRGEFKNWGRYSGYTDGWLDKIYNTVDRPAGYFALRAMADAGLYDESYMISELANTSYNLPTIEKLNEMLKRMSVADTITMLKTESRYDYLDGFIDLSTYQANLTEIGMEADVVAANAASAYSRRQRTMRKTEISLMLTAISKGRMSLGDFQRALRDMRIDEPMVSLYMEQAQLKVNAEATTLPTEAKPYYLTDAGKLDLDTIRRRRLAGKIDEEIEQNNLVGLGMSADLARAYADNDTIRLEAKAPAEEV